jgi:integrase
LRKKGGLTRAERKEFLAANATVNDWLRNKANATRDVYAFHFVKFFRWAQAKYGFQSVDAMIQDHIKSRESSSITERKKHSRMLREYALDTAANKRLSDHAQHLIIAVVRSFYSFCEAPLTTAKNEFKREIYDRYESKQFGLDDARRIIDAAQQREKAIFLIMLQSGLRIGDLLNYVNFRWSEIKPQLDAGKDPLKLTMYGGKYWTYFTTDAIHELKKYIIERGEPKDGEPIFISKFGKPVHRVYVADVLQRIGLQLGLIPESELKKLRKGHRYPIRLHQFRKLFKSESSVAGRGFDSRYGEFFMGHASGLSAIGGVYDKSPELHEDIFEKEYMKLAPYLNIYTGVQSLEKRVAEIEKLKQDLGAETVERMRRLGIKMRKEVSKPKVKEPETEEPESEENSEGCADGEHCPEFKQVKEEELLSFLQEGWSIVKELKSGDVIVQRGD